MIKIGICDDEVIFRFQMREILSEYFKENNHVKILEFTSGEEVLDEIETKAGIDILFLDIQLGGLDGVATAKKIRETDNGMSIIFLTSFDKYVQDTFRVGAQQYLKKPIKEEQIIEEVDRALEVYKINHFKYVAKTIETDIVKCIEIKDIKFIEIIGRYLLITSVRGKYKKIGTISEESQHLKIYGFIRCHKAYLVNSKYIDYIYEDYIYLWDGDKVPLSKNYRKSVKKEYLKYC